MQKIQHEGDTYQVLSRGAKRDGKVYCHLANSTRGWQQKKGFYPAQIGDWIPQEVLQAAADETDGT